MLHEGSTPSEKTLALYSLLMFTGKAFRLTELAEKFGCSKSTILRRIEAVEQWVGDQLVRNTVGRETTFLLKSPKRPTTLLSSKQLRHLIMCRDMVLHLIPKSIQQEIQESLQAAASLVDDLDSRSEAFESYCSAEIKGRIDYSNFGDILQELESAMREHGVCLVKYQAVGRTEPREHMFVPVNLSSFRESLYVRGVKLASKRPHEEVGPMVLAVHRIKEVTRTRLAREVTYPSDESHGFGIMKHEPFRVKVRFDSIAATYVRERQWSSDQQLTDFEDGEIILEFTAANQEEVVSWVLSFGRRAELIWPEDCRGRVAKELEYLRRNYSGDALG